MASMAASRTLRSPSPRNDVMASAISASRPSVNASF